MDFYEYILYFIMKQRRRKRKVGRKRKREKKRNKAKYIGKRKLKKSSNTIDEFIQNINFIPVCQSL